MIDLKFLNIILSVLLVFFTSFITTLFIKVDSPISSIINRLIISGLISLTFSFCLIFPSKSWIWIFNMFFMFYIKSVIENNIDQKNKRILREKIYESYKTKKHMND